MPKEYQFWEQINQHLAKSLIFLESPTYVSAQSRTSLTSLSLHSFPFQNEKHLALYSVSLNHCLSWRTDKQVETRFDFYLRAYKTLQSPLDSYTLSITSIFKNYQHSPKIPPSNSDSSSSMASDQDQAQRNRLFNHEPSAGVPIPPLSPTSPTIFSGSRVQDQTGSQVREAAPGGSVAQGNPQDDHTWCGIVLIGRQPGCVLNRTLSSDTLSHILINDNLLALDIPIAAGRQDKTDNPDDSKGQAKASWKEEVKRGGTGVGDSVGGKSGDAGKEEGR